jgi:hypothetical protein
MSRVSRLDEFDPEWLMRTMADKDTPKVLVARLDGEATDVVMSNTHDQALLRELLQAAADNLLDKKEAAE